MDSKIICLNCQNINWNKDNLPVSLHPVTLLQHAMCTMCILQYDQCPSCHKAIEQTSFEKEIVIKALSQNGAVYGGGVILLLIT